MKGKKTMEKIIIGYRYNAYVNKKDKFVEGYEVYCVSPIGDNDGNPAKGCRWFTQKDTPTKPLWISAQLFKSFEDKCGGNALHKVIKVFYNEFGSIADIQLVEKK